VPETFCEQNGCPATDVDGHARPSRWRVDAGADQRESAAIVLGRTIGAITLGMAEQDVRTFYGTPRRVVTRVAYRGGPRVRVATYRAHGGSLWVTFDETKVVGVGTSSVYYQTSRGLGPGAPGGMAASVGLRWVPCLKAYSRTVGGVRLSVSPARGNREAKVSSLSLLKNAYAGPNACPD
jgi:hypothetical protein